MNLHDRISNSKIVSKNTSLEDQLKERYFCTWVQGTWTNMNANLDEFSISTRKLKNMEQKNKKTKRDDLATLTSNFDPLGIITPVTLKMEIFL